jgi:hypothetical protein
LRRMTFFCFVLVYGTYKEIKKGEQENESILFNGLCKTPFYSFLGIKCGYCYWKLLPFQMHVLAGDRFSKHCWLNSKLLLLMLFRFMYSSYSRKYMRVFARWN